ncbi:sugar phosphate isomerase/epimerase family protein [Paenibacillus sp. M1]|uniref:Sugar phosphate isomerase/epimerase family protein n=1 Tax=Paenibacillus haidiansis TaxID=1574488 RepID=A0ABU7VPX6_9BACL
MKLGMPTLIEYRNIQDNIQLCKELELEFVELNMNLPIFLPETLPAQDILKLKKHHGIDFTIHLPEELDLSSFHQPIRKGHIERCKETIKWAQAAEIKTVNMHINNGIYFTLPHTRVWINEQYEERFLALLLDSCSELYELCEQTSVQLCIENTSNFHIPFIRRALEKLSDIYDHFCITWDVGHDAIGGYGDQAFILAHSEKVRHMHIHDYNGKSDHQPLFSGQVPLGDRLQFAKDRNLSVVVEVKTSSALKDSISKLPFYTREII